MKFTKLPLKGWEELIYKERWHGFDDSVLQINYKKQPSFGIELDGAIKLYFPKKRNVRVILQAENYVLLLNAILNFKSINAIYV